MYNIYMSIQISQTIRNQVCDFLTVTYILIFILFFFNFDSRHIYKIYCYLFSRFVGLLPMKSDKENKKKKTKQKKRLKQNILLI